MRKSEEYGWRLPVRRMSSRRFRTSLTGRRSLCAARAAITAQGVAWSSLPPKAPPRRKTSTVTWLMGIPSTRATVRCTTVGDWVADSRRRVPFLAGHGDGGLGLQVEVLLAARVDAPRQHQGAVRPGPLDVAQGEGARGHDQRALARRPGAGRGRPAVPRSPAGWRPGPGGPGAASPPPPGPAAGRHGGPRPRPAGARRG